MPVNKINHYSCAEAAYLYHDRKIPYSQLDCQAFVERVLADCGIYRNWKGTNDMWRNALSWKGTVDEAIAKFGTVPIGEVRRGYKDGLGDAFHVGIYTGKGKGAMHSTAGGVQECAFPDRNRWTHVGLPNDIDYEDPVVTAQEVIADMISVCETMLAKLNKLKGLDIK